MIRAQSTSVIGFLRYKRRRIDNTFRARIISSKAVDVDEIHFLHGLVLLLHEEYRRKKW
jgi:hypothetical protein